LLYSRFSHTTRSCARLQAGAREADSLYNLPRAAAPISQREPRAAEPRPALAAAYTYEPQCPLHSTGTAVVT
jgi:hypothetical protein